MDVFELRDQGVGEYRDYVESFVNDLDERLQGLVRDHLAAGEFWPNAALLGDHLWTKGYYWVHIASHRQFLATMGYVRENRSRAGLAAPPMPPSNPAGHEAPACYS